MTLDVGAAEFWDPARVDAELRRVYDICAGCRRCVGLCPSFKVMFERIDAEARVATDCPLAALQITQGTGTAPSHPIQILAEAYGLATD